MLPGEAGSCSNNCLSLHMHRYFIRTPWIVRKFFPGIWKMPSDSRVVYLSFDDGPHPRVTPWVLDMLRAHNAKASFFCIGSNVEKYPDIYSRIIDEGHAVGNHTYTHLDGWKATTKEYLENVQKATAVISSALFRPPYGKIRWSQARQIGVAMKNQEAKIIMWDVLSGDFDSSYSPDACHKNVINNVRPGSIIVFHDSEKAEVNIRGCLGGVLEHLQKENYRMEKLQFGAVGPALNN